MNAAEAYQRRIAALFRLYGEGVTMNHTGHDRTLNAWFAPLGSVPVATYFDDNEALSLVRPVLAMYLDGTWAGDPPNEGESLTRDGRIFLVRRRVIHRLAGVPLLVLVISD